MNLLDIRTLLVVHALVYGSCAIVVLRLWRRNRAHFRGLGLWAADYGLQIAALVLIGLRGLVPDWASYVLANVCVTGGTFLLYVGLARFAGVRPVIAPNLALLALFPFVHGYFTFVQPSLGARNVNLSLVMLVILAQSLWLLARRLPPGLRRSAAGVIGVLEALGALLAVRIAVTLAALRPGDDIFQATVFETAALVLLLLLFLLLTFALVLFVNERLLLEMEADITALVRAEEELRLWRQRMALHMENTPLGVVEWDPAFRVREWNPAAERIFGHPRAEALGRHASFIVPPQAREFVHAAWAELLGGKRSGQATHENVTRDGKVITCEWFNTPLVGEAGAVIGIASLVHDITERLSAERALREKNAELQRFTYSISHDLKSPLVTVSTFLGYLERDLGRADAEAVRGDLAYVRGAAEKMSRMLDEILEFSRIGRVAARPVRVGFRELVEEARMLVAGRIAARGVEVRVGEGGPALLGDRRRLVEIWQNLLDNAVKFMGAQDAPLVEVGAERREGETVFFVRDNGVGVAPEARERIFGLFDKLDPAIEGSGVGLAVARRIVETYGGRIWVESAGPGAGAVFRFTLPGALAPG